MSLSHIPLAVRVSTAPEVRRDVMCSFHFAWTIAIFAPLYCDGSSFVMGLYCDAASRLLESKRFDAVIVFGCVIKGDTPHFDYVCDSATQGVTALNTKNIAPVIFGVLTVDTEQQAVDRVGGPAGQKGAEAAETALHMIVFDRSISN